jgi:hypothetical protein
MWNSAVERIEFFSPKKRESKKRKKKNYRYVQRRRIIRAGVSVRTNSLVAGLTSD